MVYSRIDSVETGTPFSLLLNIEESHINDYKIYPNPARDRINFECTGKSVQSNIRISDLQGRILKTVRARQDRTEIDISELPAGIFIYSIISDEKILKTGKFVVQR